MPEVWVIRRAIVTPSSRSFVTGPRASPGRHSRAKSSSASRPSSMAHRSMVVQTILLTEARSYQVPGAASPKALWYSVFSLSKIWHTADG